MDEPPPLLAYTVLSEQDIEWIVTRAVAGDSISLEALFNRAAFGGQEAEVWGQWPPDAVEAWDRAVARYREVSRTSPVSSPRPRTKGVSAEAMWDAIESVIPAAATFPDLPHVRPVDIARHLPIGPRSVPYWLRKLGWELAGKRRTRHAAMAPCLECGTSVDATKIKGRLCPECALTK